MAILKTDVAPEVKKSFKQVAKEIKKPQTQCLREAIQNYITAKTIQR